MYSIILFFLFCIFSPHLSESKIEGSNIHIGQSTEIPEEFYADIKPFEKIGSKFYYIDNHGNSTWYTALMKCGEKGANLANLQSLEEVNALSQKLVRGSKYWIDLTNLPEKGKFRSITTGELKNTYPMWNNGKPNNTEKNELCALLSTKESSAVLDDEMCTHPDNFICETNVPRIISIVHW